MPGKRCRRTVGTWEGQLTSRVFIGASSVHFPTPVSVPFSSIIGLTPFTWTPFRGQKQAHTPSSRCQIPSKLLTLNRFLWSDQDLRYRRLSVNRTACWPQKSTKDTKEPRVRSHSRPLACIRGSSPSALKIQPLVPPTTAGGCHSRFSRVS
jgi:hypothetical protein